MGIYKMILNGLFGQTYYPEPIYWGYLTGWMCLVNIISLVISIVIAVFMYKDAKKRDKSGALWGILGFFFSILALIIWLVIRPDMYEVQRKRQQRQNFYGQQQYGQGYNQYGQQQYHPPQGQQSGYGYHQPNQSQQTSRQTSQDTAYREPERPPGSANQAGQTCPSCGRPMSWVQQYNRWWCDNCGEYK